MERKQLFMLIGIDEVPKEVISMLEKQQKMEETYCEGCEEILNDNSYLLCYTCITKDMEMMQNRITELEKKIEDLLKDNK